MKRKRTVITGASYYVTVRTNGGKKYLESSLAKTMFVDMMDRLKARYDCRIDNYVVLDDSIQLIVQPLGETTLAEAMSWLFGVYTQQHNRVFDGFGHIFCSRYDSRPIRGLDDLKQTFRSIDRAPLVEGLVTDPINWEWCGLRHRGSGCRDIVEDLSQWITLDFYDGSVVMGYGR